MDSESSDESVSAYTILLNSVKRKVTKSVHKGTKKRKKSVKISENDLPRHDDVTVKINQSDTELSDSDNEGVDPFYKQLSYQLTPDDVTLLSATLEPQLIKEHPLGQATLYPSPLPSSQLSSATPTQFHLRDRIARRLSIIRTQDTMEADEDTIAPLEETLTPVQTHLLPLLSEYAHVLYAQETHGTHSDLLQVIAAHIMNHIWKGRRQVLRNNQRILQGDNDTPGDQGLVRPRVLALLPFRSGALQLIEILSRLAGGASHRKRLADQFGPGPDQLDPSKPVEYRQTFAGNSDDCFKMGLALYGGSLRLFAPFYNSDVIIASPLGLRALVGAEGDKGREWDFLSSLEILFLDQTQLFQLQNWAHLLSLMKATHKQPKSLHGTDIRRVRPWALENLSRHYCQLIVLSHFLTPEIHSIFRSYCTPRYSKVVLTPRTYTGVLRHLTVQVPQVFKRLPPTELSDTSDNRFSFFSEKILPEHLTGLKRRTIIFTPCYSDFLRVRNHFREVSHPATHISEYSSTSQARRATYLFSQGQRDTLLLTERLMFFRAPRLPKCSHLLLYGPPMCPHLYPILINTLSESGASLTCIFAAQDALALARVLGAQNTDRLLNHKCATQLVISNS